MESAAPEAAREKLDGAEQGENRTSGSQGVPGSPFSCGVVTPNRPFLIWPGQPAAREMMLGLQYLRRSVSGPREEEDPARTNYPAVPKAFECRECGLTAAYLPDVVHHQSSHGGDKPYCCPECGKSFRRGSDLVKHHRVHTGEKPYPCPECGRCFSLNSNLIQHRRSHSGLRPHKCLECGEAFGRSSDIE